jgi:DNA-binding transcriptional LysR family regulator
MLDLNRLATLRAVVEAGSFTAAARALHLTQPAVSRQIALLERQLGATLLTRGRGQLELTPAGEVLLGHTCAVLDRLTLAEAQVRDVAGIASGTVRLASFFSALVHLSADVAALLAERSPELRVIDDLADRGAAFAKLGRGDTDLAIVFDHDFASTVTPEHVTVHHLFDDPVRLLLPTTHRLANRRAVDPVDLADEIWIQAADGSVADLTEHLLRRHGLDPPRLRAGHGDEPVETQALVAAGRGVTVTHDLTVIVSRHDLAVVPISGEAGVRHIDVAHAQGRRSPATATVLDAVLTIGASHRQRLHGSA